MEAHAGGRHNRHGLEISVRPSFRFVGDAHQRFASFCAHLRLALARADGLALSEENLYQGVSGSLCKYYEGNYSFSVEELSSLERAGGKRLSNRSI